MISIIMSLLKRSPAQVLDWLNRKCLPDPNQISIVGSLAQEAERMDLLPSQLEKSTSAAAFAYVLFMVSLVEVRCNIDWLKYYWSIG